MDPRQNDIERYLSNRMTDAERHALEKRALSDPFLADAIEGAQDVKPEEFTADVESLNRKIQVPSSPWKMSLRIAAGVIVAVSLGWLVWNPAAPPETAERLSEVAGPARGDSIDQPVPETKSTEAQPVVRQKEKIVQAAPEQKPAASDSTGFASVSGDPAGGLASSPSQSAQQADTKAEVAEEEAQREERKAAAPAMSMERRSTASARLITGKVTEAEDGIPLAGVIVVAKDASSRQETRTRGDGTYSLPVQSEESALQYFFPGLETVELRAGSEKPLDVQLFDDEDQRSEVIAFPPSNWTSKSPDGLQLAMPSVGIQEYQKYLEANLVVPPAAVSANVTGKVTIAVTVDQAGNLQNFEVIKGLGYGCDEEAVRVIEAGPHWKAARYRNRAADSKIWIKLKFR